MKITTQESEKKIQEARGLWNAIDDVYVETLEAVIAHFKIDACWHDELGFTQVVFAEGVDHIDNSILDDYFDEKYSQMADLALRYAKAQASGYAKWIAKAQAKAERERENDAQYKAEAEARAKAEAQEERDHELQIQENQEYHNNRANDQERADTLRDSIKTLEAMLTAVRQELRELESDLESDD